MRYDLTGLKAICSHVLTHIQLLLLHQLDRELWHHASNPPHDDGNGMGRLSDVRDAHIHGCRFHLAVYARDKGM